MKQIILPLIILHFTCLVSDNFMEENDLASTSAKKEIRSLQNRRAPRNLKFSKPLATRHEKYFQSSKKIFVGGGGVYAMESKDTNTDYQKVVRVGDQK